MSKVDHVDDADHSLVTAAVAEAERHTSGEIVTIVADLSDHYEDVGMAWASAAALLALFFYMLFPDFYLGLIDGVTGGWEHEYSPREYLALLLIALGLKWFGAWLLMKWMPLRLALTPNHIKLARVRGRAVTMFKVGTEARASGCRCARSVRDRPRPDRP